MRLCLLRVDLVRLWTWPCHHPLVRDLAVWLGSIPMPCCMGYATHRPIPERAPVCHSSTIPGLSWPTHRVKKVQIGSGHDKMHVTTRASIETGIPGLHQPAQVSQSNRLRARGGRRIRGGVVLASGSTIVCGGITPVRFIIIYLFIY